VTADRATEWFDDERGGERRLRASCHLERGMVVLSLWHGETCRGTFRLALADAPRLIGFLALALGRAAATGTRARGAGPSPQGAGGRAEAAASTSAALRRLGRSPAAFRAWLRARAS
jgi:hypothetical protein